jgi:hypothetical protein
MMLSITPQEREFLLELLDAKRTALLHELHHTDTYDYKEMLKQQLALLESLQQKLDGASAD